MNQNCIIGFIVLRLCSYNSNHALRIVDYFGHNDGLSGIFGELHRILHDYDAEYIDFYNIGIEEKIDQSRSYVKILLQFPIWNQASIVSLNT